MGFFDKLQAKEHIKLFYQNTQSSIFLNPYLSSYDLEDIDTRLQAVLDNWQPGDVMSHSLVEDMLALNKILRRIYAHTPTGSSLSFDKDFSPEMGWKKYYSQLFKKFE